MNETDPRFSNVDFGSLLEDLFRFARSLVDPKKFGGDDPILTGTGKSANDLVKDALTEFIVKARDWSPSSRERNQAELFFFVRTMIRNDFLDLIKDGRAHKRTEIIDISLEQTTHYLDAGALPINADESLKRMVDELDDSEVVRRAYGAVHDQPELKEYLDAILRDGSIKRNQVASDLGIDLRQATQRRDRLKTRLRPLMRALEAQRTKSHRA
jgi:hypothetical protein